MAISRSFLNMIIQKSVAAIRKMLKLDGTFMLDGSKTLNGKK